MSLSRWQRRVAKLEAQRPHPHVKEPYVPPMPPDAWWEELEAILREMGHWDMVLRSLGYSEEWHDGLAKP